MVKRKDKAVGTVRAARLRAAHPAGSHTDRNAPVFSMSHGTALPASLRGCAALTMALPCLGDRGSSRTPTRAALGPISTPCGFSRDFHHSPAAVSCFSSSCVPVQLVPLPAHRTFVWQTLGMWVCRTGSVRPGPHPRRLAVPGQLLPSFQLPAQLQGCEVASSVPAVGQRQAVTTTAQPQARHCRALLQLKSCGDAPAQPVSLRTPPNDRQVGAARGGTVLV